jgi:uncharacterized membrane protein SpoIIM required for sporulation
VNEVAFVEARKPDWDRLVTLCQKADITPRNLKDDEFKEFIGLYRRVSSDLALARTQSSNLALVEQLNQLVGQAYLVLYRPRRQPFFAALAGGIVTYAQTVRRRSMFVLMAFLTFLLGNFLGYFSLDFAPDTRSYLVPPQFESSFEQWKQGTYSDRSGGESLAATGFYASNNPRVALTIAALSAGTFGVGTFYMTVQNGLITGALLHEVGTTGTTFHTVVSILPHGVTEIQGMVIASAAGYVMAGGLIAPGRKTRAQSLRESMKDGIVLMLGGIVLMYIAAPFEGFFSFNPNVPYWAKIAMAVLVGSAWIAFYLGIGDESEAGRLQKPTG